MSNWWAEKIQGGRPRPHTPPAPMYTPPPAPAPAAPQAPQTYTDPNTGQTFLLVPAQQGQQPAAQPPTPPQDPHQIPQGGHGRTVAAANQWHGAGGVQDAQRCPSCKGGNYFSRVNPDMPSRNGPPMPQCYDCGYPLTQFGSRSGLGGSAQVVQQPNKGGAPRAARETSQERDAAFHPEIVVDRIA